MNQKTKDTVKNLTLAVSRLEEGLRDQNLSYLEKAGVIKSFEFVYELTWTALKLILGEEGHATTSARAVFELAFKLGWIDDEQTWLAMIKDRNLTVHTYDEAFANKTEQKIRTIYFPLLHKTSDWIGKKTQQLN